MIEFYLCINYFNMLLFLSVHTNSNIRLVLVPYNSFDTVFVCSSPYQHISYVIIILVFLLNERESLKTIIHSINLKLWIQYRHVDYSNHL